MKRIMEIIKGIGSRIAKHWFTLLLLALAVIAFRYGTDGWDQEHIDIAVFVLFSLWLVMDRFNDVLRSSNKISSKLDQIDQRLSRMEKRN